MNAATKPAIGTGNDVFAADNIGIAHDPICHHLRMLDDVRRVADDARNKQFAFRQLDVLPHAPFVLVAHVARFDRISAGVRAQHQIDDVLQRNVGGVRAVPASPANVKADAVLRQTAQRMIERLHARALEFLELSERRLGIDHVPVVGQAGIVDLQNDSGIGNRFIFVAHRLGGGEDEFLFSRVMKVFAARETA